MSRPELWTQPQYLAAPVLGGTPFLEGVPIRYQGIGSGASILGTVDGGTIIQLPYQAAGRAESPKYASFQFELQATREADWQLVRELEAFGQPFYFIPYRSEVEAFIANDADTTFTLRRPTAISQYSSFSEASFPSRATLNGVAQTLVAGAPSSGEVKIDTSTVTTPALTAADKLLIEYYPAYPSVVETAQENYDNFNDLKLRVTITEANQQTPA